MNCKRRKALAAMGTMLGAGVGGAVLGRFAPAAAAPLPSPPLPWPYSKLDPSAVAERAYWSYPDGHCMFSSFAGLVGELAEKVGHPYKSFPMEVMKYGAGGVAGWGTLCGALNGAAAAIYLASDDPDPVIDELFWWYSNEKLPDFVPPESPVPITQSVSRSPLCHVSVAEWCSASGLKAYSKQRNERCARLAASAARRAAQILNAQQGGTLTLAHPAPDEVKRCRSCHERAGSVENTRGKMHCSQCHPGVEPSHPGDGGGTSSKEG